MLEWRMSNDKPNIEAIKSLRNLTGAGIAVCKEALTACNNNTDEAVQYIIKKGMAKQKQEGFSDAGYAGVSNNDDMQYAVMIEVMSRTDFVAKNADFRQACDVLADYIAHHADKYKDKAEETLKGSAWLKLDDFSENADLMNKFISTGESITFGRCAIIKKSQDSGVYSYIHSNSPTNVFFAMVQLGVRHPEGDDIAKHIALYSQSDMDEMFKMPFIGDDSKTLSDVISKDDVKDILMGKVGKITAVKAAE